MRGDNMYEGMFYTGMVLALLNFGISIFLFVKNQVGEMLRDMMGWKRRNVIRNVCREEEMTEVLIKKEFCMESFFRVEEDIVVTHTEKRIE